MTEAPSPYLDGCADLDSQAEPVTPHSVPGSGLSSSMNILGTLVWYHIGEEGKWGVFSHLSLILTWRSGGCRTVAL